MREFSEVIDNEQLKALTENIQATLATSEFTEMKTPEEIRALNRGVATGIYITAEIGGNLSNIVQHSISSARKAGRGDEELRADVETDEFSLGAAVSGYLARRMLGNEQIA